MQSTSKVLERAVARGRIPGAICSIARSGELLYEAAFGLAATEPERAMQTDTVVRIASMTKLITSVAVMMLVDERRVQLDAPLSDYVPGFEQPEVLLEFDTAQGTWSTRPARREASLRELLSHTGGYGYWWLHEPLRIASGAPPDLLHPPFLIGEPGEQFAYSTSADVIGLLFEPVTGSGLDRFFDERIFGPLGMVDTGFRRPADPGRLAHVHRKSGSGFRQLPLEQHDHEVRGGGGLFSTAPDYRRLLQCLMRGGAVDGKQIISKAAIAEIVRNQIGELGAGMQRTASSERSNDFIFMNGKQKFGLGVMIETAHDPGKRSVGSYGWGGIVNTFFWVDPPRDIAAILMLQVAPFASRRCIEVLNEFELALYRELKREEPE